MANCYMFRQWRGFRRNTYTTKEYESNSHLICQLDSGRNMKLLDACRNSVLGFAFYSMLVTASVGRYSVCRQYARCNTNNKLTSNNFELKNTQQSQGSNLLLLLPREVQPASLNCLLAINWGEKSNKI